MSIAIHSFQRRNISLLGLENLVKGGKLRVEHEALFFQLLDDLLVGLSDTLGFVIFNDGLVQTVLQDADFLRISHTKLVNKSQTFA